MNYRTRRLRFEANVGVGLLVFRRHSAADGRLTWPCNGTNDTFPAGPARTDCYIGLSRINRQKSEISAGVAQQQAERQLIAMRRQAPQQEGAGAAPAW